jgi:hypothetical protein
MARVRVGIGFNSRARIGPGKAKLLESIRDTGSISLHPPRAWRCSTTAISERVLPV